MRKLIIVFWGVSLFIACNNNKEDSRNDRRTDREKDDYQNGDVENKDDNDDNRSAKWSSSEISDFNRDCAKTMGGKGYSDKQVDEICACLLDKFDDKYETYAEMDRKGTYEEGKTAGEECMRGMSKSGDNTDDNSGEGWTTSDKRRWMDICNESVSNSRMSSSQKNEYCGCVLEKLQGRYSTFDKMNTQGTEEDGKELGEQCLKAMGLQ